MNRLEIEKRNRQKDLMKEGILGFIKVAIIYSITCTIMMLGWNLFCHDLLGLGKELWCWWKFGLPTLCLFSVLRCLSPFWFEYIDIVSIIIYSFWIFGFLALLWWL